MHKLLVLGLIFTYSCPINSPLSINMEDRIFSISLHLANNQSAQEEVLNDIKEIANDHREKFEYNTHLIFAPIVECIDCAEAFSSIVNPISMCFVENLKKNSGSFLDPNDFEFIKMNKVTNISFPETSTENLVSSLMEAIKGASEEGAVVLIVDNHWGQILKPYCITPRSYQYSDFSAMKIDEEDKEDRNNIDYEDFFNEIQKGLMECVKSGLNDKKLANWSESVETLKKSSKKSEKITDCLEDLNRNSSSNVQFTEDDKKELISQVEDIDKALNQIKKYFDYCEDLEKTYKDENPDKEKSEYFYIDRFFYSQDDDNWRLRIINDTENFYHNIDVVMVETNTVIFHLDLIQNNCKVWVTVDEKYREDYYGCHLVIISQNKIVCSEPFLVGPFKINSYDISEDNTKVEIGITNHSLKVFNSVYLSHPKKIDPIPFENPEIGYKEKTTIWIEKENVKLFAFSGDQKITNNLELAFEDQ